MLNPLTLSSCLRLNYDINYNFSNSYRLVRVCDGYLVCPGRCIPRQRAQGVSLAKAPASDSEKALLSKVNGRVYATSHLCAHYRLLLIKGTLSANSYIKYP